MSLVLDGTNGISGCPAVSSAGGNVPPKMQDNAGKTATCLAWVNFAAGVTPTIGGAFNVSSITRNGAGVYVVNFATAMPDNNYSFFCGAGVQGGSVAYFMTQYGALSTTSIGVQIETLAGAAADVGNNCVAIFR